MAISQLSSLLIAAVALYPRIGAGAEALQQNLRGERKAGAPVSQLELAAREGTVEQFVTSVASVRIPIGIVIAGVDLVPRWQRPDGAEDRLPPDFEKDALDVFEARRPTYKIHRTSKVYRITPVPPSKCVTQVEGRLQRLSTSGRVVDVVDTAVRSFNRDQEPAPPVSLGILGHGDGRAADIFSSPVSLDLTDVSLADLLDEVVKSAPGIGWAVREMPDHSEVREGKLVYSSSTYCNVTLFSGDGWLVTSWNLAPKEVPAKRE